MGNSLVKIDIHLIFHIKSTGVKMRECDLNEIFAYVGGIIKGVNGIPIEIGGRPDHIHVLTTLPKVMPLSEFVRIIKSNSSKWLKLKDNCYKCFEWQEGYGAFSVSPTLLDKTIRYIRMQEEHHVKRNAKEEYKMFLDAYKVEYDERFLIDD
ncbi:MAG: transposase [Paludibacteraceae bacterium]|jgi:REP element-mobilizing transposase RayT|nr:transposase [Paludibacteraceae bacterium]